MDASNTCNPLTEKHKSLAAAMNVFRHQHNVTDIADALGRRRQVLSNKLNEHNTTHHLTVAELVELTNHTGDNTLVDSVLLECGMCAVRLTQQRHTHENFTQQALQASAAAGELSHVALQTQGKRRFSRGQRQQLRTIGHQLRDLGTQLVAVADQAVPMGMFMDAAASGMLSVMGV